MTTAFAGTLLALIAFTATVALFAAAAYIAYLRNKMSAQMWALDYMQEVYDLQTQESLKIFEDLKAAEATIEEDSMILRMLATPSEEYAKISEDLEAANARIKELSMVLRMLATPSEEYAKISEDLEAANARIEEHSKDISWYGPLWEQYDKLLADYDQLEDELAQLREQTRRDEVLVMAEKEATDED